MTAIKENQSPNYGGTVGHWIFHQALRFFGPTFAYVLLMFVVPYYVIFRKSARNSASYYLKHRFPNDGAFKRFFKTILYFYKFGIVQIDQAAIGILGKEKFMIDFPNWEEFLEFSKKSKGFILLTSHVGSWQTAMATMENLEKQVYFHFQLEPHTAGRHFFDLAKKQNNMNIINPAGFLGGSIEMANVLKTGNCVAIMGDRSWGARTQMHSFLGEDSHFPITPYYIASATQSDIVMLQTVRTGKLSFRIEYIYLTAGVDLSKLSRNVATDLLLKRYVQHLEDYLQKNPYMWFNFYDFWDNKKRR